jgi:hypothetical protein
LFLSKSPADFAKSQILKTFPILALSFGARFHHVMFHPLVSFPAFLAVIFLTLENTHAQDGGRTRDLTFNAYYETLVIPFSKEVIADLKLNNAQITALKKLGDRDFSRANMAERAKHRHAVLKLLIGDQRERFEQLTFQYQGALASFLLPGVAAQLALTSEQKHRLLSIQYLLRTGAQNLNAYEKSLYGVASQHGRFTVQLQRSCDCVAESVLVPAQMMKWREMQGNPLRPRPANWN